jgi:UDP-sugar pyrophosphorylase
MTSDDTDAPTRALLAAHANFGMGPAQISIIKQEKVPCLQDGDARLALDPSDRFSLLTKPHGHGDVHSLLHSTGIANRLLAEGRTHLIFIQDTNALVFGGVPAALGVSLRHRLVL